MTKREKRKRCRICNHVLASCNRGDTCFRHTEGSKYTKIFCHPFTNCSSRETTGFDKSILQYNGFPHVQGWYMR